MAADDGCADGFVALLGWMAGLFITRCMTTKWSWDKGQNVHLLSAPDPADSDGDAVTFGMGMPVNFRPQLIIRLDL